MDILAEIYRTESRRILSTLIRLIGDFDLAEEALAEAFAAAAELWPEQGVPENPRAWLVSTGRFRVIDSLRRRIRFDELQPDLHRRQERILQTNAALSDEEIEDDRLRLIFTCCHPAIDPQVQIALTLREVCGLTTEEIAAAFLVAPATMAQRIVRGKARIRDAGIPYQVPGAEELAARLESVLSVCYLVFNEGYCASGGDQHTRPDLSGEAIRLVRLLSELLPDAEVFGLLALMLLHESRRPARTDMAGDLVLLEQQDRALWNRELIDEASGWLARAFAAEPVGAYTIQAAISAVHAEADDVLRTDWARITAWYDLLLAAAPSPIVELNRAVAISMRDGPAAGLAVVDTLPGRNELAGYHLLHAARADLLRRLSRTSEAAESYREALRLCRQEPERRFLERRLREMSQ